MVSTVQLAPTDAPLIKGWTMLAQDAVQHSVTGVTTETTFATVNIPAGRMGPNGFLRITSLWSFTNNANNKTPRIKLAGNNIYSAAQASINALQLVTILRNRNAQNSQVGQAVNASGIGSSSGALVTMAVDTSLAQNLTITGQLANAADTMALESYSVDLLYGA